MNTTIVLMWLKERLREPSTYSSIAAGLVGLHIMAPDWVLPVAQAVGIATSTILGVFLTEKAPRV